MRTLLRMGCLALALALLNLSSGMAGSGLSAKVTLADGETRTVTLEGLGCNVSICSRTVMKSTDQRGAMVETRLDSLRQIRAGAHDHAQLLLKDGTERRVSLIKDFRVLYLGQQEKLD